MILGAFVYGNMVGLIPFGSFSERYGGKWVFFLGSLLSSVLTILTPTGASLGIVAISIVRASQGVGHVSSQTVLTVVNVVS